jgi:hypothetical protein
MEMHNMPILSVFVKGQTFVFLEMEGKNELKICSLREFVPFRNLLPTAMGMKN